MNLYRKAKAQGENKNRYGAHCVIIIFCIFIVFVHGWKIPQRVDWKSEFRMREVEVVELANGRSESCGERKEPIWLFNRLSR